MVAGIGGELAAIAQPEGRGRGQGKIEPNEDHLEDGIAFAGVAKFPARVKCALLGWSAFADAVARASNAPRAPQSDEFEE